MPTLNIECKLAYTPFNIEDAKIVKRLSRNVTTIGSEFIRKTTKIISGATNPSLAKHTLNFGVDIGTLGYVMIEGIKGSFVGIGTNPAKTANITDGGGGTLNLYIPLHGLVDTYWIVIDGATYSGMYQVTWVDVNNIKVTETYTSDESTVDVYSKEWCEIEIEIGNGLVFFRLNDGITNLYAVADDEDAFIEIIGIED